MIGLDVAVDERAGSSRDVVEAPPPSALDEMVRRALEGVGRGLAAVGAELPDRATRLALEEHLRDRLAQVAQAWEVDRSIGADEQRLTRERDEAQKEREDWKACALRAEQSETVLEAQVASLTLDRDAARELLDAEAARHAVEMGELRDGVRAMARLLARSP